MNKILNINFSEKRIYGLDILRATAILVVLFSHAAPLLPGKIASFQEMILPDGVFLFFVLSGFLIGTILIKILVTKNVSFHTLQDFWTRRWFRTIPTYFLILTILIFTGFLFHGGISGVNPVPYYFFIQNFNYPNPAFFPESWTLSVEEWFYLIIPTALFILAGLFKLSIKKSILSVIIAIIIGSIAIRLYKYSVHPPVSMAEWDIFFRKVVITRLDSLVFGVLGAYIAFFHREVWVRYKKLLFIVGLLLLLSIQSLSLFASKYSLMLDPSYGLYLSVFSFSITAFAIFLLLPLLSEYKKSKGRIYKVVTYISISSYSMYLIHLSLIQPFVVWVFGVDVTRPEMIVRYVTYLLLTIICSILLYKYFEKPTTEMRERFTKKHTSNSI